MMFLLGREFEDVLVQFATLDMMQTRYP